MCVFVCEKDYAEDRMLHTRRYHLGAFALSAFVVIFLVFGPSDPIEKHASQVVCRDVMAPSNNNNATVVVQTVVIQKEVVAEKPPAYGTRGVCDRILGGAFLKRAAEQLRPACRNRAGAEDENDVRCVRHDQGLCVIKRRAMWDGNMLRIGQCDCNPNEFGPGKWYETGMATVWSRFIDRSTPWDDTKCIAMEHRPTMFQITERKEHIGNLGHEMSGMLALFLSRLGANLNDDDDNRGLVYNLGVDAYQTFVT